MSHDQGVRVVAVTRLKVYINTWDPQHPPAPWPAASQYKEQYGQSSWGAASRELEPYDTE